MIQYVNPYHTLIIFSYSFRSRHHKYYCFFSSRLYNFIFCSFLFQQNWKQATQIYYENHFVVTVSPLVATSLLFLFMSTSGSNEWPWNLLRRTIPATLIQYFFCWIVLWEVVMNKMLSKYNLTCDHPSVWICWGDYKLLASRYLYPLKVNWQLCRLPLIS